MRLIDTAALPATPWKNGSGITREVLCFPAGAGLDDFDWRMSIAEVAAPGPFSIFRGIERTILLLDGAGMVLTLPDGSEHALERFVPFHFPGEKAIDAALLDGPTRDLNLMARRGRCFADVQVLHAAQEIAATHEPAILMALQGVWKISGEREYALAPGQVLLAEESNPQLHCTPAAGDSALLYVRIQSGVTA